MSWAGQWPSTNQCCACFAHSLAEVSTPSPGLLPQLSWVPALSTMPTPEGDGKGRAVGSVGGGESVKVGERPSPAASFPVLSAMVRGAADGSRFLVWDYEEAEVDALLDRYFETYPPEQVAASPDPTA